MLKTVQKPQSHFINTFAWSMLVLNSILFCCTLLQAIALIFLDPAFQLSIIQLINGPIITKDSLLLIAVICLFISVLGLLSSIGLLKRKEWARQVMLLLLASYILILNTLLISQWVWVEQLPQTNLQTDGLFFLKISAAVWVVSLSFLAGWLIKRLDEKQSKLEFR